MLVQSSASDCHFSESDELCAWPWTGKYLENVSETEAWQLFGDRYQSVPLISLSPTFCYSAVGHKKQPAQLESVASLQWAKEASQIAIC